MRPSGVLIESRSDQESGEVSQKAFLVMTPDNINGIFFGGQHPLMATDERLIVPVGIKSATDFQEGNEETRQNIIDSYIHRVENTSRYFIPTGGVLGQLTVRSVLECDAK